MTEVSDIFSYGARPVASSSSRIPKDQTSASVLYLLVDTDWVSACWPLCCNMLVNADVL